MTNKEAYEDAAQQTELNAYLAAYDGEPTEGEQA